MAQSRIPFLDKFTKPRQPPPEIPQPPFSSSNTTEDFIDLEQIRVDDSQEEPKQSFIQQFSVVDTGDNDDFYLLQEERNARGGGSNGGDGNGTGGLSNPNPPPRSLSETLEDWHTNGWLTEILAVIASFACAVTIPVVLGIYNNDPVPRLPWDVSLNAVVSVLSTVAKSSLLCAICAALGQDKWDWYDDTAAAADSGNGHDQPQSQEEALYGQEENGNKSRWRRTKKKRRRWLKEMGTLDQASRGPLGAVKILTNRRTASSPASLGALVIILSLVVDPFTQQTVSFRERQRLVASDEVWAARARAPFFCRDDEVGWEPTECVRAFQDAIYAAIWIEPETYKPVTHAQCPSGDCKWEPFNTIEYCLTNGVIETPTGYCDLPSFNQSEFDEDYIRYDLTGNSRGIMRYCDGLLEPLTRSNFYPESIFDMDDDRWASGPLTFADKVDAQPLEPTWGAWSEYSVLTRFEWSSWNDTPPNFYPYLMTTFPTEVIIDFETYGEVGNLSEMHIPDAVVLMGHTRYDMLPQVYHVTTQGEITKRYQPMIELRVNMTDWSALSICQVERTMSIVNGTAVSAITSSKYLQEAYYDVASEQKAKCWAPEGLIKGNATMSSVLVKNMTGFFSPDNLHGNRSYQADDLTGAFCLQNAELLAEDIVRTYLSQVYRVTKATTAAGFDDMHLVDERWETPYHYEEDIQLRAARISRQTLPSVMTSITAALNNMNYAATNERVTGSYVVRETILVARWEWLTVLFGIEILGMGYLLHLIFRPRAAAGVWKDSIFAVLYHGLDDGARSTIGHVENLKEMKKATEHLEVRLNHAREDKRVVLVREY